MKQYILKKDNSSVNKQYLINYKELLNPAQYDAVTHINGPLLVIAGAGSGKTRALVYRVSYLIENGIAPESILLLTFTRKSASEMMRRAASVLDNRCLSVSGGTFHSFANLTLRRYASLIGLRNNFTIIDRSDAEDIINLIRTELGFGKKDKLFPKKNTILKIISKSINTEISIDDIIYNDYPKYDEESEDISEISVRYTQYKFEKSILDYDDLLIYLKKLLIEHDDVRKRLSNHYKYIMIDEYQDTNRIQADITSLLASEHGNVMAVGDDSQSIYSFRGANFRNIMDFPTIFQGCKITTLEQNYRSTSPILNLTNQIIANTTEKYSKVLFTNISGTQKPVYIKTANEYEQASFISQRILELHEEGINLNDIAVLFRSGSHSNVLEFELTESHIPFVKYGGLKFTEAAHIKDINALLRIIFNPMDAIGWHRVLLLLDGIGAKSAENIIKEIIKDNLGHKGLLSQNNASKKYRIELERLYKLIETFQSTEISPSDAVKFAQEYYTPILEKNYDDPEKRINDLDSLIKIAARYDNIERFLTDLTLEPPEGVKAVPVEKDRDRLVLSTIHSAKGLEWNTVFVIHLVEGFFPSIYNLGNTKELDEERRLFYVACTRAKENLYLLSPEIQYKRYNYSEFSEPSRFITEIDTFNELSEQWSLSL
ncbi:MAG: ATP-dependent helicase [Nitrospirae bacterium]|nr:ATP-dependent helicase [Nitrospirota bacterium]